MEKLIIKKNQNPIEKSWKPVVITKEIYDMLQEISNVVNIPKSHIATRLLKFALEYTEIVSD